MAIDSAQKRMSALNPASPWRGPLVDAAESGFEAGNRAAAVFLYSGLVSSVAGINGPIRVVAAAVFRPGAKAAEVSRPGAMAGETVM